MPDLADPSYSDTAILLASGRLLMLAASDKASSHGYAIARRMGGPSGDCCTLSPAMIYPAIGELGADGVITCEVEHRGRAHGAFAASRRTAAKRCGSGRRPGRDSSPRSPGSWRSEGP